jgi:hypothetical protein
MLYKAKDVVEGKDPKNWVFVLKWRKIQLQWRNGRTCTYTVKARKCLYKTKIGIIRKIEEDSQNKKQELNNENEDSCNHKTRKDQLRDTKIKNRANVYKLQWDLGKKLR